MKPLPFVLLALAPLLSFAADPADLTFPPSMVYNLSWAEPTASTPKQASDAKCEGAAADTSREFSVRINCSASSGVAYDETAFHARVRDVVYNNDNRADGLAKKFEPVFKWDSASRQGPHLTFKAPPPLMPGSYTVTVEVQMKIKGDAAKGVAERTYVQSVPPITLQVPAPQIVPPALVRVDRVYLWPGAATVTPTYYLSETSGKNDLTGVTIADVSEPTAAEDVPGAQLEPTAWFKGMVPAGGRVPIVFTVAAGGSQAPARFPLGPTHGKLSLTGHELAAPITIPYVVRTRLARWTIAAVAASGILFGLFVRKVLLTRKEIAAANAAASRQLAALNEALNRTPDSRFTDAVTLAIGNLQRAARPIGGGLRLDAAAIKSEVTVITTAISTAAQALVTAETELQARRQVLEEEFATLAQALALRADFSPAAMALRQEVAQGLNDVKTKAEQRAVAQARGLFESLRTGKLLELVRELDQWRKDAADYLSTLVKYPPATTAKGLALLGQVAAAAELEKASLPATRPSVAIADVPLAITSAHQARSRLRSLMTQLQAATDELVEAARVNLLPAKRLRTPGALDLLFSASRQFADSLSLDLDTPAKSASGLIERRARVKSAWQESLADALPTGANLTPVNAALDNNDWEVALTKAAALLPAPLAASTALDADSSTGPAATLRSAPAFKSTKRQLALPAAERETNVLQINPARLEGTEAEALRFEQKAQFAELAQSCCFGVISIGVAYGLYGANWVGTPHECLVLFFWGFGLDLTADAVLAATKRVT